MAEFTIDVTDLEVVDRRGDGARVVYGFLSGITRSGKTMRAFVPTRLLNGLKRDVELLTPPGMNLEDVGLSVRLAGDYRINPKSGSRQFNMEDAHVLTGPEAEVRMMRKQAAAALRGSLENLRDGDTDTALHSLLDMAAALGQQKLPQNIPGLEPVAEPEYTEPEDSAPSGPSFRP